MPVAAPHHACRECHLVFPEHMMQQTADRWHCLPCHVTVTESAADRKERQRYTMGLGLGFRGVPMWLSVGLGLLAALALMPRFWLMVAANGLHSTPDGAEPWSEKPLTTWPSIQLVNEAELEGVPKSTGGSGFLIEQIDGHILGATISRRLALGNPEDEPSMTNEELNRRFISWRMFPTGAPERAVSFRGFHGKPTAHSDGDVWLLASDAPKTQLPTTPLKVRRTTLLRSMRLFVIARPLDDPEGRQQVFPCTVQNVAMAGELVELAFENAVISRGFAGAPIVDMHGHLAGIVIGPGEEPREDGAVTWIKAVGVTALQRLTK